MWHLAARKGRDSSIKVLHNFLKSRNPGKVCPGVDLQDKGGDTPLHIASRKAMLDSARELLAAGASCVIHNLDGNIPLHLALLRNGKPVEADVMDLVADDAEVQLCVCYTTMAMCSCAPIPGQ